jgi:hypothetical protein
MHGRKPEEVVMQHGRRRSRRTVVRKIDGGRKKSFVLASTLESIEASVIAISGIGLGSSWL